MGCSRLVMLPAVVRLLGDVCYALELVLDVFKGGYLCLGFFEGEATGVVGVELGEGVALGLAFLEVFVVVESTVVGWHSVEIAHVDCLGALFVGEKGLVHFLAMTDADDFDVCFITTKELAHGFCLSLDGAGWGFLYEDVAVLSVLEGEEDKVDGFF